MTHFSFVAITLGPVMDAGGEFVTLVGDIGDQQPSLGAVVSVGVGLLTRMYEHYVNKGPRYQMFWTDATAHKVRPPKPLLTHKPLCCTCESRWCQDSGQFCSIVRIAYERKTCAFATRACTARTARCCDVCFPANSGYHQRMRRNPPRNTRIKTEPATHRLHLVLYTQPCHTAYPQDLDELREMIEQGKVKPVIDPTPPFRLETVLDMYEKIASHRTQGKLRLAVLDD